MKLSELASQTGATCNSSDGDIEITGAAGLGEAKAGQVAFLSNPRYTSKVNETGASAIYVSAETEVARDDLAVLRAKDPYLAFTRALNVFHPRPDFTPYLDQSAVIDSSTTIPQQVYIDAHVSIGKNVTLGDRVRI